jgi:type IV secretion system protein VirB10
MTEPVPSDKVDPETLVLRVRPRRVIRIKRHVLIAGAAVGCLAMAGMVWLSLAPTSVHRTISSGQESDPEKHKASVPDQIAALPKTYADVPQLGAPLPGDLGRPILEHQQRHAGSGYGPMAEPGTHAVSTSTAQPRNGLFFAMTGSAGAPAMALTGVGADPAERVVSPLTRAASDFSANAQSEKMAFLTQANQAGTLNPHALRPAPTSQIIMAGTVISAALITGLNSDLPGLVLAQVTRDVRDSATGMTVVIPRGTRIIGKYDSQVAYGQSRILIVWQRFVWPDGRSLEIDNLPAADTQGFAGLEDRIDAHTATLLKGMGLSTLLGIAGELGRDDDDRLVAALRQSTQDTANVAGQRLVDHALQIQPSLTVRPGWPLRLIVEKDLDLTEAAED